MTRQRVLSLVPWLFALHSVEEGATIDRTLPALHAQIPETARQLTAAALTASQFRVALALVTAAVFVLAFTGPLDERGPRRGYVLLVITATLLLNVASHAIAAAWIGDYVPGLLTAVCVNLPFSVWLLRRAWRERWYRRRTLALLAPLALVVHGPVLMGIVGFMAGWPVASGQWPVISGQ